MLHLLTVFGAEVESMIPHGAYIILEIHKINEIYEFQRWKNSFRVRRAENFVVGSL